MREDCQEVLLADHFRYPILLFSVYYDRQTTFVVPTFTDGSVQLPCKAVVGPRLDQLLPRAQSAVGPAGRLWGHTACFRPLHGVPPIRRRSAAAYMAAGYLKTVGHAILSPYAVYLYWYVYRCACTYRMTLRVFSRGKLQQQLQLQRMRRPFEGWRAVTVQITGSTPQGTHSSRGITRDSKRGLRP